MNLYGYTNFGYNGNFAEVLVDNRKGIPSLDIVGLKESVIDDTKMRLKWLKRLKAAIQNNGLKLHEGRTLISLSPADLPKNEGEYDLAIALAMLTSQNSEKYPDKNILVLGDLTLSGAVRAERTHLIAAIQNAYRDDYYNKANNFKYFIVPEDADVDKYFPKDAKVLKVNSLSQAVELSKNLDNFISVNNEKQITNDLDIQFPQMLDADNKIVDEKTQTYILNEIIYNHSDIAKSVEVAIAGKHNILLTGEPGCGKHLILDNLIKNLTPKLTEKEAIEHAKIYDIAGLHTTPYAIKNYNLDNIDYQKPEIRNPHCTASIEGMCGGGPYLRPGEITLAHNGTLYLNEAAEFRTSVLHVLRIPLETKAITLSRAGRTIQYPADFQLAITQHSSPDGHFLSDNKICISSDNSIKSYWNKISEPVLNRIEIKNFVEPPKNNKEDKFLSVEEMKKRIATAYKIQRERGIFNGKMTEVELDKYARMDNNLKPLFEEIVQKDYLNKKELNNLIKVSLTLANMDNRHIIQEKDFVQAYNSCCNQKMQKIMNFAFNRNFPEKLLETKNQNKQTSISKTKTQKKNKEIEYTR